MRIYLKKLREDKGYTIADMARKLDISESYYSLIECGKRQEKMDLLVAGKLAAIFEISISKILAEEKALHEQPQSVSTVDTKNSPAGKARQEV